MDKLDGRNPTLWDDVRRRMNRGEHTSEAALARTSHLPVDFMAISRPPTTPEEKQQLREAMDDYLCQRVDRLLCPLDRASLGPETADRGPDDAGSDRIMEALDTTILELAPEFGWRLWYSDRVRERVAAWFEIEPNGAANFEKFGKQLALGARARSGGKKLRITVAHRQFKDSVVPELKLLMNFLKALQSGQNRAIDENTLLTLASLELEREGCPYRVIQHNRTSFSKLVSSTPGLLQRLTTGGVTPASFADEWVARVTNQQPESARQAMSEAPSRGRRQPKRLASRIRKPKL
jgi:hypothetical protein